MGYQDDLDLYAYVGDDPLSKTDPTGKSLLALCATRRSYPDAEDQAGSDARLAMRVEWRHLVRAAPLGAAIGIASSVSSAHFTGDVVRGIASGLLVALAVVVWQAWIEAKAERQRSALGIRNLSSPVRPMMVLDLGTSAGEAMVICRAAVQASGIRIKRVEIEEPLRLVFVTPTGWSASAQRGELQIRDLWVDACEVSISSVPCMQSIPVDVGVNYTNVFRLAKLVTTQIGTRRLISEKLVNLDDPQHPIASNEFRA